MHESLTPDLISCGNGIDIVNLVKAIPIKSQDGVCQIKDKNYGVTWCRGGYALISNPLICADFENLTEIESLLVSQGEYTQPLAALAFEGIMAKNVEVLAPMDAYVKFVSGKVKHLLGTQRDVNRLATRGMEVSVQPLSAYNDLYQYVSICAEDQLKRYYAEEFIKYLVSEKVQYRLKDIGMLSPYYKIDYQNEHLASMQEVNTFSCISAFTPEENIKELQRLSLSAINGDEQAKIKIKNMLI
jgi:hypothetical protein